jgi:hypothetical protein
VVVVVEIVEIDFVGNSRDLPGRKCESHQN